MSSIGYAARSALLAFTVLWGLPGAARAQSSSAGSDKVAAQALFEDGRQLVAAGKYAEACPKFADSQRLDPSPSTLLNLANCWEKLGRTATAWAVYREAESAASAARRQDYMAVAERHATALAPTLARLTIAVPEPVEGIEIKRDGVPVGSAAWGTAIPVDAGSHLVEASAPAYKEWKTTVDVPRDGAQVTATVPALEPFPVERATPSAPAPPLPVPTPSPSPAESPPHGSTQGIIGLVVSGAGAVGLGVSGVLALIANGKKDDSLNHCPTATPNRCDSTGVTLRNQALSAGDAANVAFAIGAAALVTGGVLWLTAPRETRALARVALVPVLGGAAVEGSWP
jgi:serine/threonine-protein kinase